MTDANEELDLALVEAALEEKVGGLAPPDLAAAVLAAAGREQVAEVSRGSGWRWLLAAAALVACGAGIGWWWRARGEAELPRQAVPQDKAEQHRAPSSEFYVPRDVADAQRILGATDAPDVQFHFVGEHRLPTDSVMGPPAPTLALGRWGLGKALAMTMRKALDGARPVPGFDAAARPHTIFVNAGDQKRMRLAMFGNVLWVDGLGGFAAEIAGAFTKRLHETELETRRALGLVHREELGVGLPNELIAADQKVLRPFGLEPGDVGKLAGLKELRTLDLRWCDRGHDASFLWEVAKLTSVRELRLRTVGDFELIAAASMRWLESLVVLAPGDAPWRDDVQPSCARISAGGFNALQQLTELETLVLPGCGSSRSARPDLTLLAKLPKLRTLVLTGARHDGDEPVWEAFAAHQGLKELRLGGSTLASASDLDALARLPALEELSLVGCWPAGDRDRVWAHIVDDPILIRRDGEKWVDVKQPEAVAQALPVEWEKHRRAVATLRSSPKLRRLSLGRWFPSAAGPIDDATRRALVEVASTPSLRWLDLSDNPGLRLDDLLALGAAKQLDTIVLCGTAGDAPGLVPTAALAPLLDAIPGLTLVTD